MRPAGLTPGRDGSNAVSLISARTNTVTATIPANGEAFGIAVNTKTNKAYAADTASNTVLVLTHCPK